MRHCPGRPMNKRLWISVLGSVAVAFALAVGTAQADPPHGGPDRHGSPDRHGAPDRHGGPGPRPGSDHMDARFGHNHYYPSRGYEVRDLPRERFEVNRFNHRYYYSGG